MNNHHIITIERQYASGGQQIGSQLAEKLGYKFYNDEILSMAAKKLNIAADYVKHLEETSTNSFLYTVARAASFTEDQELSDKLFYAESELINSLALTGNCVIVGRCASQILANNKSCLSVFIHANEDVRIKRAVEEYGVLENEARDVLRRNDKRRAAFYNARADKKWASMDTYDVCLNSGALGIDGCVELLASLAAPCI